MKTVYVAGAISGKEKEAAISFHYAECSLRALGFAVCNPIPIGDKLIKSFSDKGMGYPSWFDFMRACLPFLCKCDYIFLLSGWKESKGARWEYIISKHVLGIPCFESYEDLIEGKAT